MPATIYASSWPKLQQYYYYLNTIWGKMVSTVNCGSGEKVRDMRWTCPNQLNLTGVVCPQFDDSDIANIIPVYLELYPEHRGFEERMAWIIRCTFGPGCIPMPPAAAKIAPYVAQRARPIYTGPAPAPASEPVPYSPAPTPTVTVPVTQYVTKTVGVSVPVTEYITKTVPVSVPVTEYVTKTVPVSVPVTEYVTRTLPVTVPYTIEVTRPYTIEVPRPYTVEIPVQVPYTVEVPVEVPSEKAEGIPAWMKIGGIGLLAYFLMKGRVS